MIVESLLDSVEAKLEKRTVKRAVLGLGYTGVELDDGSCGLAATLRWEAPGCCSLVEGAGELDGRSALELAREAGSARVLRSSLGLATLNAVINNSGESNTVSPLEALDPGPGDSVGMVGYFGPLIEKIGEKADEFYVFERRPSDEEFVYPDWAADQLLPECDKVIISGTTLINKTMEGLLKRCRGEVGILGPSTPLSPVLADYGVDYLFGSVVVDPERVLKIIAQGGGTRTFGDGVRKINLELSRE